MSKIIILFLSLTFLIFFSGCKAPACSTLSWGEVSQVEENGVEMKFSAGKRCGNFNDYWDNVDVDELIKKIQTMKFVKVDNCIEENLETGESEIVECPEFIPETIEFGEVVGCEFGTPPGETICAPKPLNIYFNTSTYFEIIRWMFNVSNPKFYPPFDVYENLYSSVYDSDNKRVQGRFNDEGLSEFIMMFEWGKEEKREVYVVYSVETKE